ncbi:hypothetical protein ACFQ0K_16800 [Nocardioides caeni]|uniref:Uncharacterized protein n=1 Tax=Nocardioides caeni TaxID=574700 RepID=A0A4S8NI45_9ACTN|nr:hypothetical protein [Nocardioides caeni]THV16025.1 hypothetical protein E9934_06725 [Nocardioides caeni]
MSPDRTDRRPARHLWPILGLLAGSVGAIGVSVLTPAGASSPQQALAERPIIVGVEGDAANGFGIDHADGTSLYPPTDSEAIAECGEYDTRAQRIRCRVEVRTWYRDLGDLQRSLAWVRANE